MRNFTMFFILPYLLTGGGVGGKKLGERKINEMKSKAEGEKQRERMREKCKVLQMIEKEKGQKIVEERKITNE